MKQCTNNKQPPKQKVNWDRIYQEMEEKNTYSDLEHYVETVETADKLKFQNLYRPIIRFPRHCNIDKVALHSLPEDCPKDYVPIYTTGDGNCLPRALSIALFGSRKLLQGIMYKDCYGRHYKQGVLHG